MAVYISIVFLFFFLLLLLLYYIEFNLISSHGLP